jgi:sugar/nucleoside kinase (ribokinase family)
MTSSSTNVLCIGNAIVDIIAHADDAFLIEHDLAKGAMRLIDEQTAVRLHEAVGPSVQMSGGSAGNTSAGIASLGGKASYIGKVKDDALGTVFAHDLRAQGVHFATPAAREGPATARCLVLVTPDAERTMSTFLGASIHLKLEDIDAEAVASSAITYLEGYLFDPPDAKRAFCKAARIAHEAGRKVALSLSDTFCVSRHRQEFRALVDDHIDILFANEDEVKALYEVDNLQSAIERVAASTALAAITRGAKGAILVEGDTVTGAPAVSTRVVDTTGAGDLYAAGVLVGLTHSLPIAECARIGAIAAGEVISHVGGRPQVSLVDLI